MKDKSRLSPKSHGSDTQSIRYLLCAAAYDIRAVTFFTPGQIDFDKNTILRSHVDSTLILF